MTNAATGSERIAPGQHPSVPQRRSGLAGLTGPAITHWQFSIVVLGAVLVRTMVILGYPPIMWFNDSYNYLYDAVTHIPDEIRPNGYPFFLDLLLPLHSPLVLALLQAAMGVAMGVGIYALLRRRGLPWWGAVLPALPVLFDSYQLRLEHMITADTLFTFLVTVAVLLVCWNDRPSVPAMAVAGILIGYATVVRSVGQPLLAVVFLAMLVRWVGWRRLITLLVAGIVPIAVYMVWFHHTYGKYALTESRGAFLYSRTSAFAECAKISPPARLRPLCDPTPPYLRPVSGEYIWANNELGPDSSKNTPLYTMTGSTDTSLRFTPPVDSLTEQFAVRAILAQPLDYLHVVTRDTLHTFGWNRQPDPYNYYGNGPSFQFSAYAPSVPWWAGPGHASQMPQWASRYGKDVQARQIFQARQDFGGSGLGNTDVHPPWGRLIQIYQRYFYLRGTLFGLVMLIGAAGVAARWRRWGGVGLLPWLVGALLIVLPPMTAGFSYRYVLAAVPTTCLAAGLAFARRPEDTPVPAREAGSREDSIPPDSPDEPRRSVRARAADLRRHLGRRVAVEQE